MSTGFGFGLFGILFMLISILSIAAFVVVFIVIISRSASENNKNDQSPVLTVPATVVAKRTHVWGDHAHTNYYVTFQVASGDRMELNVPHNHFGYLVDGDQGNLTFQGTRFLSFERT